MGKKDKQQKAAAQPPPPPDEEIPLSGAQLPLLQLDERALGEFFELCFSDKRLLELCGELRLYSPGYRLEAMPPDQVARMLADEVRAAKDAHALIDKAVREALRNPVLEGNPLTADHYRDLLELFTGDPLQHIARIAWKALLEQDRELRQFASLMAVDFGVEALDAPARAPKPRKPQPSSDVQELRKLKAQALEDVRRAAPELRPKILDDLGLGSALVAYVARWSERTGVLAAFQSPGLDGDRLPPEQNLSGAEVHAKVRCGNHRLGYSLFYGVWEFFYEKVVFFF